MLFSSAAHRGSENVRRLCVTPASTFNPCSRPYSAVCIINMGQIPHMKGCFVGSMKDRVSSLWLPFSPDLDFSIWTDLTSVLNSFHSFVTIVELCRYVSSRESIICIQTVVHCSLFNVEQECIVAYCLINNTLLLLVK
ncbi:hypothetical protein NL108_006696 [Boleophthalmus pectinirostris]|nr:hypothetical protein NL108_006696 [Boleophthalmus pectinirostris]